MRFPVTRRGEVFRLKLKLERDGFPRLQMSLLVAITGASGFIASFVLLQGGMQQMPLRYLLACLVAYAVFLLLLWLWLRTKAEDYVDNPDCGSYTPSGGDGQPSSFEGGGGDFGGGGASGDFDSIPLEMPGGGEGIGDAIEVAGGTDELAIPLLVLILVMALLLSSLYVVYTAPVLFAELLLDGVLAAGLYRRLSGVPRRHWLETALRRTIWPFLLTALLACGAGWGMQSVVPGAKSLGEVIHLYAMHD